MSAALATILKRIKLLGAPQEKKPWEFTIKFRRTLDRWEQNVRDGKPTGATPATASDIGVSIYDDVEKSLRKACLQSDISKIIQEVVPGAQWKWSEDRDKAKADLESLFARLAAGIGWEAATPLSVSVLEPHLPKSDVIIYDREPPSLDPGANLLHPQLRFPEMIVGRGADLSKLMAFLLTPPQAGKLDMKWWAMTGGAGSGKTRTALEFCYQAGQQEWHAVFLKELPDGNKAAEWRFDRKMLIVLDSEVPLNTAGQFAVVLASKSSRYPLRLLLLQRRLPRLWRSDFTVDPQLLAGCKYESENSDQWLELKKLEEGEFVEVYERALTQLRKRQAPSLTPQQRETLLQNDPQFLRPLFAVAAAVNEFRGKSSATPSHPLCEYVMIEAKRWREAGVDDAHVNLLVLAAIVGGLQLQFDIGEQRLRANGSTGRRWFSVTEINRNHEIVPAFRNFDSDWLDLFQRFSDVVEPSSRQDITPIPGVQPDLLGEALFLLRRHGDLVMGDGRRYHVKAETRELLKLAKRLHFRNACEFERKLKFNFPDAPTS